MTGGTGRNAKDRPIEEPAAGNRRADGGPHGPWTRHQPGQSSQHARRGWGEPAGQPVWGSGGRGPRLMRRMGCLFGVLFLLTLFGAASVVGIVASALGLIGQQPGGGAGPIGQGVLVILVVVVVIGLLRLGRGLRGLAVPLDDLVDAARRIESGDLAVRIPQRSRGRGELRALVAAFNTMAERLEIDERQRRTLLADISHELRTPLAVVRGNLEAIQDGVHPADPAHLQAILDETNVMARLVDDLRTVALAEAGTLPLYPEPTDLGLLASDVVAAHAAAARGAGVDLVVEAGDVPSLELDPVRMREVVTNLLANALRYTPAGGTVRIAVTGDIDGGALLTVTDTGSGVDPAVLPHIFDRFWKSPDSRGSGLGLAIVRNLVERHGGSVDALSRPGAGTTISIRLPGSGAAPDG